jgi:hypothetical protein
VQLSDHHRYHHTLVLMLVGVIPAWPPELWHRAKWWPHARRRILLALMLTGRL